MNAEAAKKVVRDVLGVPPLGVTHMTFGHNSVTYEATLPQRHIIVRMNADPQVFAKTEHNLTVLKELGLPVPQVLAVDLTKQQVPFAYMLLDKIPGRDLRYELAAMTPAQMTQLAQQIVGFQRHVMMLPPGTGYGYMSLSENAGRALPGGT